MSEPQYHWDGSRWLVWDVRQQAWVDAAPGGYAPQAPSAPPQAPVPPPAPPPALITPSGGPAGPPAIPPGGYAPPPSGASPPPPSGGNSKTWMILGGVGLALLLIVGAFGIGFVMSGGATRQAGAPEVTSSPSVSTPSPSATATQATPTPSESLPPTSSATPSTESSTSPAPQPTTPAPEPSESAALREIRYYADSSTKSADVEIIRSDGTSYLQEGLKMPLQSKTGAKYLTVYLAPGAEARVKVMGSGAGARVWCTITVDGETLVSTQGKDDPLISTCSATVPEDPDDLSTT